VKEYGETGRDFYRLEAKAARQERAAWTMIAMGFFLFALVVLGVI
jgi:hypothetical protein